MRDSERERDGQDSAASNSGPPLDDEYMGPRQLAYFKQKLLDWRSALLAEAEATLAELQNDRRARPGVEFE